MWLTILDCVEKRSYLNHQLLWSFFPEEQKRDESRPFCYREVDGSIYMLSSVKPATKATQVSIDTDDRLLFHLAASCRSGSYRDERGIRHRRAGATKPSDQAAWLQRRLGGSASINFCDVKRLAPHSICRKDGKSMVFPQSLFRGVLTVRNAPEFERILSSGIGQGSSFGLGMMLLPQVMK